MRQVAGGTPATADLMRRRNYFLNRAERIDGKRRDTPDRAEPLGYLVRPSGTKVLPASSRPTCG